jgi:ATP-dependent protease ClpP protease subunit
MDFSVTHVNPFDRSGKEGDVAFVLMRGEIKPGDYNKLIRFSIGKNIDLLASSFILASPGGDIAEALAIGRLIKDLYAPVMVGPQFGPCASACFIIFASAVDRTSLAGLIGIHRPYVAPARSRALTLTQAEREEAQALLDAEKYLHALRVPNGIIDEMFAKASTDIHWLSDAELEQLGFRPPWYEEVLVARCGLNTREESIAWDSDSVPANAKAVSLCAAKLTAPDAEKNLTAALARYEHGGTQKHPQ